MGNDLFGGAFDDTNIGLKSAAKVRDFDCVHSIALKWEFLYSGITQDRHHLREHRGERGVRNFEMVDRIL